MKIAAGLALSLLVLAGCDKACKKTVTDTVQIQNFTGRILALNVCKGRSFGPATVNVAADTTVNTIVLGTREETDVRGGTDSCSSVSDSTATMGIALSSAGFGQVKLCFDDVNGRNIVVEAFQACPAGTTEQTAAATCN